MTRFAPSLPRCLLLGLLLSAGLHAVQPASATALQPPTGANDPHVLAPFPSEDRLIQEAREALKKRDKNRLRALRNRAMDERHPLASWIDYWDIGLRLVEARQSDLEAFYERWPGTYVEDRLRNDWLLELGRQRDWTNLRREFPRFRMNDDREVTCYALTADHLAGKPVAEPALVAWLAQREADTGCDALAEALVEDKVWPASQAWLKLRQSLENNRPKAARQAADLLGKGTAKQVQELLDNATRYLDRQARTDSRTAAELTALALARRAQEDADDAARRLDTRWEKALPPELAAWAWAQVGRLQALRLDADALASYRSAWAWRDQAAAPVPWGPETLAWSVRAALRDGRTVSWRVILRSIDDMSPADRADPAWQYWRARALRETAKPGAEGQAQRDEAQQALSTLATPLHFYGKLAAEDLGRPLSLPPRPAALTAAERDAAHRTPGLERALRLIALGLRSEGVREWNFTLRGMNDRQLLAAAQWACDREVWDRCINTSDRTRQEIDVEQRFPTPFRRDVVAKASAVGVDPAYVYGLIRQESRFITDARSHVGASGLMQVMPATAKWTAKKIGLPFSTDMITDRDANLTIGTSYLKLVLEDFGGSQALAAAAYNAGPSRPRRWREGSTIDAAAWAETIPFNETRDYVKKVLSNATLYDAVIRASAPGGAPLPSLKARLGAAIGPRGSAEPGPDRDIP